MHSYRVGQEKVTRARLDEGWRKATEIAEQGREIRVRQVGSAGVQLVVPHQRAGQDDIDHLVDLEAVARLGQINLRGKQDQTGRERKALVLRAQEHRSGQITARRSAAYDDARWRVSVQHIAIRGHRIVQRRRIWMLGRHPVIDAIAERPRADPPASAPARDKPLRRQTPVRHHESLNRRSPARPWSPASRREWWRHRFGLSRRLLAASRRAPSPLQHSIRPPPS